MANINVKLFRYNPSEDKEPSYKTYEVPRIHPQMSVLQALRYIHDEIEPISFEYCCRAASCGSCSVMMNGTPVMACVTKIADGEVTIEPLKGFRVIKDLIVDKTPAHNRLYSTSPWFTRVTSMTKAESMPPGVFEKVNNLQLCKDCLCCLAACPQVQALGFEKFAGPYIMIKIASRYFDTREESAGERLKTAVRDGLFNCIECGTCHVVCPRGELLETPNYPDADIHHVDIYKEMKAAAKAKGWEV